MNITASAFQSIKCSDIDFLRHKKTLYSIDFRATGESLDMDIDAMFKYENLTQWLSFANAPQEQRITTNDTFEINETRFITHVAPRTTRESHLSVYDRLPPIRDNTQTLWVGVPHPAADKYAQDNDIAINYNYSSFLKRNDKILQKKLLGDLTPKWKLFDNDSDFRSVTENRNDVFLKKRHGAGGYGVIALKNAKPDAVQRMITNTDYTDWYIEDRAPGTPYSVQGLIDEAGQLIVFGVSEQQIETDTVYVGATIYDIATLSSSLRRHILEALNKILPLLEDYTGFFGVDFMVSGGSLTVLECNIRLTAASIPTLLRNNTGEKSVAIYQEDKKQSEIDPDDIILTTDQIHHTYDILRFNSADSSSFI